MMYDFYQNPAAAPLRTPSGLIEIVSQELREHHPDDKERAPLARFVTGGRREDGWMNDEARSSTRFNTYPHYMMCTINPWQYHSMYRTAPWSREIPYNQINGPDGYGYRSCWIHPETAAQIGVKTGDIIMASCERGAILGGAFVTEKIKPGCAKMDKAGGSDEIIPAQLNRGGSPNAISPRASCSYRADGLNPTGYLVKLEKVTGEMMDEWKKNYPEAFERDYDWRWGPIFTGWVEQSWI